MAIFLITSEVSANCELLSNGFHTIGTYVNSKSFESDLNYFVNFQIFNSKIQIRSSQLKKSIEASPLKKINMKGHTCDVEKLKLEYVIKDEVPVYSLPVCAIDFPFEEKLLPRAIFNEQDETIYLPLRVQLVKIEKNISKFELEKNIRSYLVNKNFTETPGRVLNPQDYQIESFEHHVYSGTEMYLTVVKASSKSTKSELKKTFEIAFLSTNNNPWYIADSSYIEPCLVNAPKETKVVNELFLNSQVHLFDVGWVYGNSPYPQIIEFKSDNNYNSYFIEFGKRFIVLEEEKYRTIMRNEPSIGIQSLDKK